MYVWTYIRKTMQLTQRSFQELGAYLQRVGHEFGVTTVRPRRCGGLDIPMLRFTSTVNGYTSVALTKLDILDDLDEIKIGVEYRKDGEAMRHFPSSEQDFSGVEVEYVIMPGWKTSIAGCRSFQELPENARAYVLKIEELLGIRGESKGGNI